MQISPARLWLYRFTALHFAVTATTGLALYFRPLDDRAGLYSKAVKEWLVMIHNGEWLGEVLVGNRYVSGLVVGLLLSVPVARFVRRALRRAPDDGRTLDDPTRT